MNATHTLHYSTYARTILSDLENLATLIRKYSLTLTTPTTDASAAFNLPTLLTIKQIEEALLNPQSAIKPSMVAYATLLKMHRDILNALEAIETQRQFTQEGIQKLRKKFSEANNEAQKNELSEAIVALESSHKNLVKSKKQLIEIEPQIKIFKNNITELTLKHDTQWETFREQHLHELLAVLESENIPLSDMEKTDFLTHETWAEILLRFQTLGLEIPTYLNLEHPGFTTYFKLKLYLATHASLSRRLLPHTPEDLSTTLKKILRS